jgi:hypothetical protein
MPTGREVLEVLQNAGVYPKAADDLRGALGCAVSGHSDRSRPSVGDQMLNSAREPVRTISRAGSSDNTARPRTQHQVTTRSDMIITTVRFRLTLSPTARAVRPCGARQVIHAIKARREGLSRRFGREINGHEDRSFVMIVSVPYGLVAIGIKPLTYFGHHCGKLSIVYPDPDTVHSPLHAFVDATSGSYRKY